MNTIKVEKFTRSLATEIAHIAAEKLNKELAAYGIRVDYQGGNFSDKMLTGKFQFSVDGFDAAAEAFKKAAEFDELFANRGSYPDRTPLKMEYLGATFIRGGRKYTVTGFDPKRPKFEIITTREDGKRFLFTREALGSLKLEVKA